MAITTRLAALLAVAGAAAALAGPAGAARPRPTTPIECGYVQVKNKSLDIRADQLRCKKARKLAIRHVKGDPRMKGYSCQDYTGDAVQFRCNKGIAYFFAIKRS